MPPTYADRFMFINFSVNRFESVIFQATEFCNTNVAEIVVWESTLLTEAEWRLI